MKGTILALLCLWALCGDAQALVIQNPDMEEGVDTEFDFQAPIGWQRENYTALHSQFTPSTEYDQHRDMIHWTIPSPYSGNSFVVLSTGDLGPGSDPLITLAKIWQPVEFVSGEKLSFAYFFGTCDYLEYADKAKASLIFEDGSSLVLMEISVYDVGSYGSTDGWQFFEYTFTEQTAGTYDLVFQVEDDRDALYKSYFAIDGIAVVPEPVTAILLGLGALALRRKNKVPHF
jgi:hypothetical protein